ncbi:MAG: zinc ABC transporter substrate-binding protein, partial [Paramuribaculum sp.]|nr:zinc ABC transporter substrate-binding protein [Paramuribaculum sp.]
INTLLDKGSDPENFDPSISDLKKLASSGIYFQSGYLPFESALTARIGTDNLRITDTSAGIKPLTGTHHHNHSHEGQCDDTADPHIWTSPRNAKIIAHNMLSTLIEIDSVNAEEYKANYRQLEKSLDKADSTITAMLDTVTQRSFVVWHPSLSYFAKDYGLEQIILGADNKELSVESLKNTIDEIRHHHATVMFIQPDMDYGRSQIIAAQANVPVETINTASYDFINELVRIAGLIGSPKKH